MKPVLLLLCAVALILILAGALLLRHLRTEDRLAARINAVTGASSRRGAAPADAITGLLRPVAAIGGLIARSGLLSVGTVSELQQTLGVVGLSGRTGLSIFIGAKLLLLSGLPLVALAVLDQLNWWPTPWPAMLAGAGIGGLLLPDFLIRRKRKAYLAALDGGMPDALDMLVICSEAGLGLEAAFERVADEIGPSHPIVAQEMQTTLQEMRINADRRAALIELGRRTGLDSLRRLGSTLVQTMQYGTPLSQALRTLSAEMRQEMLTRFEGRAARLPVLLTLPMIVFILPCVFLVVGGPAVVQVVKSFYR